MTPYDNLEAVARNLLDGLDVLLKSGSLKCSIFLDGPTIEMLRKVAKPLAFGRIKDGINNGIIEFLGGGYHDPMLPLFPEYMQSLQLEGHKRLLARCFDVEPQGFYNSSLVWEMGMISVLEQAGYDYALVSEAAVQDSLGRATPVSGWYTIEDKGSIMRIVPVADALSMAIENDDLNWKNIAAPYCRDGKSAVVSFDLPPESSEIVAFIERLVDFVETNEVQTRPVGYMVNQLPPEGSLSYLISAGRNLGLPTTARTCREMLIRRSDINLLHKAFLDLYRRGKNSLDKKRFDDFCEFLKPSMSPIYFRDLSDNGMQSLTVREWGFKLLIDAAVELDSLIDFSGLRMDVCDYLLQGRKQIVIENQAFSCLLDYHCGGVLRALFHKGASVNLINSWRNDGEPSFAMMDCLLPNVDTTPMQIDLALSGRENVLTEPYAYQICRVEGGAEVQLQEEQGFAINDQRGVLHIDKTFGFNSSSSDFFVSYKICNSVYVQSKFFFGTLFELGLLDKSTGTGLTIDGSVIRWDKNSPIVYPEAKELTLRDEALKCSIHLSFDIPASIFVGPIFSAAASAAPEDFQGVRVFPFWRSSLNTNDTKQFKISVSVTRR